MHEDIHKQLLLWALWLGSLEHCQAYPTYSEVACSWLQRLVSWLALVRALH